MAVLSYAHDFRALLKKLDKASRLQLTIRFLIF